MITVSSGSRTPSLTWTTVTSSEVKGGRSSKPYRLRSGIADQMSLPYVFPKEVTVMRTSWLNKVLPVLALLALIGAVLLVARSDPVETIASPPHPPPVSEYRQTVAAVGLVEPSS